MIKKDKIKGLDIFSTDKFSGWVLAHDGIKVLALIESVQNVTSTLHNIETFQSKAVALARIKLLGLEYNPEGD